jgi:hypothetical protein
MRFHDGSYPDLANETDQPEFATLETYCFWQV